jgi:hypothetical protein
MCGKSGRGLPHSKSFASLGAVSFGARSKAEVGVLPTGSLNKTRSGNVFDVENGFLKRLFLLVAWPRKP